MNEVIKHYEELIIKYDKRVMKLENIINKAIEYIEKEFIIENLDKTEDFEKDILIILEILEGGKDTKL